MYGWMEKSSVCGDKHKYELILIHILVWIWRKERKVCKKEGVLTWEIELGWRELMCVKVSKSRSPFRVWSAPVCTERIGVHVHLMTSTVGCTLFLFCWVLVLVGMLLEFVSTILIHTRLEKQIKRNRNRNTLSVRKHTITHKQWNRTITE